MAKKRRKHKRRKNARRSHRRRSHKRRRNPSHARSGGHHKRRKHRRRGRRRNPGGPMLSTAIGAGAGILLGLGASAGLSFLPVSPLVRSLIRGGLAATAIVVGAKTDPVIGAAAAVGVGLPAVRDTLQSIPGLEQLPIGDIGRVHTMHGVQTRRLPGMRGVHTPQMNGLTQSRHGMTG